MGLASIADVVRRVLPMSAIVAMLRKEKPRQMVYRGSRDLRCEDTHIMAGEREKVKPFVDYLSYLRSQAWATFRLQVITRARGICERCGRWPIVNVHHLTYQRLGHERLEDVIGVCSKCHKELHDAETA